MQQAVSAAQPSEATATATASDNASAGAGDEVQATADSATNEILQPAAAAHNTDDDSCSEGDTCSEDMDWEQQRQQPEAAAFAAGAVDGAMLAAFPASRKRRLQQQDGGSDARRPRHSTATNIAAAAAAAAAAGGAAMRPLKRGAKGHAVEELPGGILQCRANAGVDLGSVRPPSAFAGRCFPQLPCEVPLQLEMAPAAAGAGVASERPAGAPTTATAKLTENSCSSSSRAFTYMSTAAAGLGSYRGFRIIAWQAPKPDSSGSNSSRLTILLQSPAAQQAATAAVEQAAAEAAAAVEPSAGVGAEGGSSGHTWHAHVPGVALQVRRQPVCPAKLVAAAFLPHHPAGTRSLQLQLSVFKDDQPVSAAAGGADPIVTLTSLGGSWTFTLPAVVFRQLSGSEVQLMRATAPNLLQVFTVTNSSSRHAPAAHTVAAAAAAAAATEPAASEGGAAAAVGFDTDDGWQHDDSDDDTEDTTEDTDVTDGSSDPSSREKWQHQQTGGGDSAGSHPAAATNTVARFAAATRAAYVVKELPGGIIQCRAAAVITNTLWLPKSFAMRCFPQLPCEVPLQLEMAPAAAGAAGVASERPAGAPTTAIAKLRASTRGHHGKPGTYMAAAGLRSYRGFKIIAWQAPTPDSSGSNSSQLTMVLQSPAAQQAVTAAAGAAAEEQAAAAAGDPDDQALQQQQQQQQQPARGAVMAVQLSHQQHQAAHHAGTGPASAAVLDALVDPAPGMSRLGSSSGAGAIGMAAAGRAALSRPTLLQLQQRPAHTTPAPAAVMAAPSTAPYTATGPGTAAAAAAQHATGGNAHAATQPWPWQQQWPGDVLGVAGPGSSSAAGTYAEAAARCGSAAAGGVSVLAEPAVLPAAGEAACSSAPSGAASQAVTRLLPAFARPSQPQQQQPAQPQPEATPAGPAAAVAQLPAGYELPPVDSAAAGMQQLLGLLQLLQADQALLAKCGPKLARLQQAPVGDRQLHWFAVSYEMVRTWLHRRDSGMVLQCLQLALM